MAKKINKANFHNSINRPSKSALKKTLRAITEQRKEQRELRSELHGMAKKALTQEFGTFVETFNAMLVEHLVMKDLLMELAGIDIAEWNKRYNEKKEKRKKTVRKEGPKRTPEKE